MATSVRDFPVGCRVTIGGNEHTVKGYNIKGDGATSFVCVRVSNGAEVVETEDNMTKVSVAAADRRPLEASNPPTNL